MALLFVCDQIVKYLVWQLSVIVYWLHRDMNCCHLDLTLENIMLQNATFIENSDDGTVSINPNIKIKVCDFGLAEIFRVNESTDNDQDAEDEYAGNPFKCTKHGMKEKNYLSAPRVFADETYDARKAGYVDFLYLFLYEYGHTKWTHGS